VAIYETHCHLNHEQFADDWEDVLGRAQSANVRRLLVVGYDIASSRRAVYLASANADLRSAVGIHPEAADEWSSTVSFELIEMHRAHTDTVLAIGEIGLDYYWKTVDPVLQKDVFAQQLALAESLSLPVIVHCREAYDDTLDIIERFPKSRGVLHCFTGSTDQAQRALALGFYIGVGGIATFKNSNNVRSTIKTVPIDRLLLETDSPFLAPQAWRGKRNEPSHLPTIVTKMSEVLVVPETEVEATTWQNAVNLFG
jgi:TatD DNase family protein